MFASAVSAAYPYITHTVVMRPYVMENPENPEEGDPYIRIPGAPVQCTIDATAGIQFVGMEKPEILTFELYDLSGACMAVFGDEDSFLDFLFAQSGEYQIRLVTANWAYVGYIGV